MKPKWKKCSPQEPCRRRKNQPQQHERNRATANAHRPKKRRNHKRKHHGPLTPQAIRYTCGHSPSGSIATPIAHVFRSPKLRKQTGPTSVKASGPSYAASHHLQASRPRVSAACVHSSINPRKACSAILCVCAFPHEAHLDSPWLPQRLPLPHEPKRPVGVSCEPGLFERLNIAAASPRLTTR